MSTPESSTGLILRTRPLTETSLIAHWLTREAGRIATVAKGARRPKSPFLGKIDLFFLADFSFVRSRRSDLHTLREVKVRQTHADLRINLGYLRQAAYAASLVEQTTEAETPLPEVFDLMSGFLEVLPHAPARPQTVLAFELKLLRHLGLEPDPQGTRLSARGRDFLKTLVESDWGAISGLPGGEAEIPNLRHFLHGFMIYHLGRLARGREAAVANDPAA